MAEKPKPQKPKTAKKEAPNTEPEKADAVDGIVVHEKFEREFRFEEKAQKPQTPETEAPKTEPEKAFCRTTYREKDFSEFSNGDTSFGTADPTKMRDISKAEITELRDIPYVLEEWETIKAKTSMLELLTDNNNSFFNELVKLFSPERLQNYISEYVEKMFAQTKQLNREEILALKIENSDLNASTRMYQKKYSNVDLELQRVTRERDEAHKKLEVLRADNDSMRASVNEFELMIADLSAKNESLSRYMTDKPRPLVVQIEIEKEIMQGMYSDVKKFLSDCHLEIKSKQKESVEKIKQEYYEVTTSMREVEESRNTGYKEVLSQLTSLQDVIKTREKVTEEKMVVVKTNIANAVITPDQELRQAVHRYWWLLQLLKYIPKFKEIVFTRETKISEIMPDKPDEVKKNWWDIFG